MVDGIRRSGYLAIPQAKKDSPEQSTLFIHRDQYNWGYYYMPPETESVRTLIPARLSEHPQERALGNTNLLRVKDRRFDTAMIVHPSHATYASAHDAGAIILYLPGATCLHSQATAMLAQLTYFAKKGYPGVAIDHAFHGSGPQDAAFMNLNAYMAWVHSIVKYAKRMHADVPLGIFGRSTGANVALEYASRYPGEAAFIIAMSGYHPSWSSFSTYHIEKMAAAGEYQLNPEGNDWALALDHQWTWQESTAARAMMQNNVMILAGNRDDEYPWHAHQAQGEPERGYHEPPPGDPHYIAWWRKYAAAIGAELLVVPDAEHNLFDLRRPRIAAQAQKGVLDFLGRIVPAAGSKYFVGQPFHSRSTIMELPSDTGALRENLDRITAYFEQRGSNTQTLLDLIVLHQALSHHEDIGAEERAHHEQEARRRYDEALPKIRSEASLLLLGRPVKRGLMQSMAHDALAMHDPLELLPMTKSVGQFLEDLRHALLRTVGNRAERVAHAIVYDFGGRPVQVELFFHNGAIRQMLIRGTDEVLNTLKARWEQNAGILKQDDHAISHHRNRKQRAVRHAVAMDDLSTSHGRLLTLELRNDLRASPDTLLSRFPELFFQYWPHPAVRDFVRRLDGRCTGTIMIRDTRMTPLQFVRDNGTMYVRTPLSASPQDMTLTLPDLRSQVEHQEQEPNRDALSARRLSEQDQPSGAFAVTDHVMDQGITDGSDTTNPMSPAANAAASLWGQGMAGFVHMPTLLKG